MALGLGLGLHLGGNLQKQPNVFKDAEIALSLEDLGLGNITKPINVRRSTDNAEQEFSYIEITDGSLTTFCGAGDGFIVNWYDQSNNANHIYQTTASEQPKIVSAGTLILENGKPIVSESIGDKRMQLTTSITGANYWIFEVGKSAYYSIILSGDSNNAYAYASESGNTSAQINKNCTGVATYINGILTPLANRDELYTAISVYHLAAHNIDLTPGTFDLLGYVSSSNSMRSSQTVIIYSSDPEAGREEVEAKLKSRYNTP